MLSIGWDTSIQKDDVKYKGHDANIKRKLSKYNNTGVKIVITRGLVPGNEKSLDLGHVSAPVAKIYVDNRYLFTVPYRENEWVPLDLSTTTT